MLCYVVCTRVLTSDVNASGLARAFHNLPPPSKKRKHLVLSFFLAILNYPRRRHVTGFLHVSSKLQKIPPALFLRFSCSSSSSYSNHSHLSATPIFEIRESNKMQSMLVGNTARTSLGIIACARLRSLQRALSSASRSRTADPAIHSGEREAGPAVNKGEPQGTTNTTDAKFAETEHVPKEDEFLEFPQSPHQSSVKLKSSGVNQRLDPMVQQKRKQGSMAVEEVSCAGLDGSPWPDDERNRGEKLEDEREYYQHHKASPLSELKFADSRKPITRATDGTADSGAGRDVIGWLPEQLDTAEDSLRRATEIWRQNAMRGDPDAPQSRVLRALRGEDF